jgi:lipoprotein-releasing system ATP-binding protein
MSDGLPLSLRDIRRTFLQGDRRLDVLRGITLDLKAGEIVALVGQSGSGKSTLLHIAGLLERPDGGEVMVDGKAAGKAGDGARTALRRKFLGFIYQYHHLLPEFSALENVMLPQMLAGLSRRPPARPLDGRRAAAGRDRPRRRQRSARAAGRRADRQPRCLDRRDGVPPASRPGARDRHGRPDRHPQPRARGADGPDAASEGRSAVLAFFLSPLPR